MDGACAHHRGQVQPVGQRIEVLENFAFEHPHPAGAVGHFLASYQCEQIGKKEIAHPARHRHLTIGACHARANDQIAAIHRFLAQLGEVLRRVGAVCV